MAKKQPTTTSTRRIEYLPLDEIRANPSNPKGHDVDTINGSVHRFGYIDSVAIDERTGYLISGHGRTKTLRAMKARGDDPPDGIQVSEDGAWLVPVQVGWSSQTDTEAKAALISLNRTTELGGWVDQSLLELLDTIDDYTGVGFTGGEVEDLRRKLEELGDEPAPGPGGGSGPAPFVAKDLAGVQDLVTLHHGDCIEILKTLPDASVDAVVTDPPYGLGFMGQKWDTYANESGRAPSAKASFDHVGGNHNPTSSADAARTRRVESARFGEWCELWTVECLRVLKPGGHMIAFGGSRTWHRLAAAVEDAGFEIRDSVAWLYGSGFPKSLDVSKAIDKAAGAEREVLATIPDRWAGKGDVLQRATQAPAESVNITAPATPDAERWQGWGTALKPAFEPIVVGRKPLGGSTVAANVLAHGTGALNIDGCRVGTGDSLARPYGGDNQVYGTYSMERGTVTGEGITGRWPANVVLDESQAAELDRQSGTLRSGSRAAGTYGLMGYMGDEGGASRFFPTFRYEAKAPTSERPREDDVAHPTVKPVDLMRWLVRLVTPPGGVVLEPFAGSGTTLEAAVLEGFACIGIEREASYLPLIRQRLGLSGDAEL